MSDSRTIIKFPKKPEPWVTPQPNFESEAYDFVAESPGAQKLCDDLRACASPFIRAAIIQMAVGAEDVPFLLRIAEQRCPDE